MARITESTVRIVIAQWLSRHGYAKQIFRKLRERGSDIRAQHINYPRYFIVEVKGDPNTVKDPDGCRSKDFRNAIGQLATRMTSRALYHYGLAFPITFKKYLRKLPWIFCKRNRISVFFVDSKRKVERYSWRDLKNLDRAA